jgi:predicted DNA-binding transcriptional regulator YafY
LKLDRLVSILILLRRRERVQAKELAQMFEVSVRTILRDVDARNLAGIPIVTYQGANGGIGIAEGYRLDRSVLSGDDMAAIITMLKGVSGSIPDRKYQILLEKLRNSLPSSQAEAVNTRVNQLVIDLSPWGGSGTSKDFAALIKKAIEDRKEIEIEYVDSYSNRTNRRVEPY